MNDNTSWFYNTPSRKPTEHHCNADKKNNPFLTLDTQSVTSIAKNLFNNTGVVRAENVALKMLR
jgi:hypothetical protein